ncbi:MAG: hypothetical protein COA78_19455 [Blastopirellula sp.]|nr:MAG: hypothetical protein COA78_19455 [Blastopirellula sp.]
MNGTISRRMMLRGLGTAMALPWLESLGHNSLAAAPTSSGADGKPPVRMAFLYVPNGMHMPDWTPAEEGDLTNLPKTMQSLNKVKSELTPLSGLTLNNAHALGDGGGDHARSVAAFLTGAHPKKTNGADIANDVSVDQLAASKIGHQTRFPSLELGCEPSAQAGNCDSGYSCVYTSNMAWRNSTSHVGKEVDPQLVFDRLFGNEFREETRAKQAILSRRKKSILDFVLDDARRLNERLGKGDKQKLDEYLYSVREIEQRLQQSIKLDGKEIEAPDYPRPAGVPAEMDEHIRLMMDMMVLAFQTNSTRIASFMYTNAGSNRSYSNIGVAEGHHNLSHHGNDEKKQSKIAQINSFHVQQLAYFLEKLQSTKEHDGSLLDNCMVMYGSGISDGNRHNHNDLPILLAGRGGGAIRPGRHLRYADQTPLTNLYLMMLEAMGIKQTSFGDSKAKLTNLS